MDLTKEKNQTINNLINNSNTNNFNMKNLAIIEAPK